MSNTIDTRGLSCPQPVLLMLQAIEKGQNNEFLVLVDTETAKENVIRAATSKGWQASIVESKENESTILLKKE